MARDAPLETERGQCRDRGRQPVEQDRGATLGGAEHDPGEHGELRPAQRAKQLERVGARLALFAGSLERARHRAVLAFEGLVITTRTEPDAVAGADAENAEVSAAATVVFATPASPRATTPPSPSRPR